MCQKRKAQLIKQHTTHWRIMGQITMFTIIIRIHDETEKRNKAREQILDGGVGHVVNHVIIFVIKSKYLQSSILHVVSILLLEKRSIES